MDLDKQTIKWRYTPKAGAYNEGYMCGSKEAEKARPNEQIAWEQGYEAGVAQGKQDRTKGECISRSALKKKLQARHDNGEEDFDKGYNIGIETAIDLIDNAQTVEPARPQGEWIPMSTDCRGYSESFKCSICGAYIYPRCLEKELDYNLCPYCGADMRKGGAE